MLNKFLSDYGTWYLIGLGIVAIGVALYFPQGIWGYVSKRFGLQLFPVGRRVVFAGPGPGDHTSPQNRVPQSELANGTSQPPTAGEAA